MLYMSKKKVFVGDIHGNFYHIDQLSKAYPDCEIIQVGDFGVGFGTNKPPELSNNVKFIRGNHDNLEVCKLSPNYIEDGYIEKYNNRTIMYVGGAWSIDQRYRTPGVDWWENEELTYQELQYMIEKYEEWKPDIMVTHDCPSSVSMKLFVQEGGYQVKTRTGAALQTMLEIHEPSQWFFGHWHTSAVQTIGKTVFRCLNIEETYVL